MSKRKRFFTGHLVASTNTLKNIMGKRLEVEVKFTPFGGVFSQKVVAIRCLHS
jgi:hypothetical protein